MKNYIGIDIGKFKHCVSVVCEDGTVPVEPTFFNNDDMGFRKLIKLIGSYRKRSHLVGMEDTGVYNFNLLHYLLDRGYNVALINPATTDGLRKMRLRSSKNDKKDSLLICSVLLDRENYRLVSKDDFNLDELKYLTRYHHQLADMLSQLKNSAYSYIDRLFPEYPSLFAEGYGKTFNEILLKYPSAKAIASTDIRNLRAILKKKGRGRIKLTAEKLKETAKKSIGKGNAYLEFSLSQQIELIEKVSNQMKECDRKIKEFSDRLNSPIETIPGVGYVSAMSIISEYKDFSKFDSVEKLISYAGADPGEYQSGNFNLEHTAISKKGSAHLRKTLYQCIQSVIINNPVFEKYYKKKRAEGKTHFCACGHCVRKLLRIIYKLMTTVDENGIHPVFNPALVK